MPELPEVETVRRAMEHHLLGRTILAVDTSGKRLRQPLPQSQLLKLRGDTFVAARRRAKYLLLDLASGRTLLVHHGMTGNLLFRCPGEKHDHVVFQLNGCGKPLVFQDARRFGMVLVLEQDEVGRCPYLQDLGPEPLGPNFNADYLKNRCRGSSRAIKNAVMDAQLVVGVGNIYASEALFRAGIHPTTPAGKISENRFARLVIEIRAVLCASIRQGGTTISDYKASGNGGRFQLSLAVYGRAGKKCNVCDGMVRKLLLAGRSTFYCPRCQH